VFYETCEYEITFSGAFDVYVAIICCLCLLTFIFLFILLWTFLIQYFSV